VGSEGIDASASAPLYWLLLTGIPGLVLLLAREATLLASAVKLSRRSPAAVFLIQALVVVMTQHTVYGSWMNPNYFVLAVMVLVSARLLTQGKLLQAYDSDHPDILPSTAKWTQNMIRQHR